MKKEEILEKSRNEKFDEREDRILSTSYVYSFVGILMVSVIVMLRNVINRKPPSSVIGAILFSSMASSALFKYRQFRRKKFLIAGVLALVATINLLVIYFIFGV